MLQKEYLLQMTSICVVIVRMNKPRHALKLNESLIPADNVSWHLACTEFKLT